MKHPQQKKRRKQRDCVQKSLGGQTATACCSIFGRLGDCLLKYCPLAVGPETGTEW